HTGEGPGRARQARQPGRAQVAYRTGRSCGAEWRSQARAAPARCGGRRARAQAHSAGGVPLMLRLPRFRVLSPRTYGEAAKLLDDHGAGELDRSRGTPSLRVMLVAGGTDLFPNMKRRQFAPEILVSLAHVRHAEFYREDGMSPSTIRSDEVLTDVTIPREDGWRSTYVKLRDRGSFDFPIAAVAAAVRWDGRAIADARVAITALSSRPIIIDAARAALI